MPKQPPSKPAAPKKTESGLSTRVLRVRIKNKHAGALRAMAHEVNFIWNYANDLSYRVWQRERRFMSGFEFAPYTNGASKAGLGIGSAVFQEVCEEFAKKRRQAGKVKLAWRGSDPKRANRSLGGVPFKTRSLAYKGGQVQFQGLRLSLWDSYGLSGYELGAGSVSEGSRGSWYLSVCARTCSACGTAHDRDTNSAINIRERGLAWLETEMTTADSRLPEPASVVNKARMHWHLASMRAAPGQGRPAGGRGCQ